MSADDELEWQERLYAMTPEERLEWKARERREHHDDNMRTTWRWIAIAAISWLLVTGLRSMYTRPYEIGWVIGILAAAAAAALVGYLYRDTRYR